MSTLQEVVIRLGQISPEDVNKAIFAQPESSVLDAVETFLGATRAAGLRERVAHELGIESRTSGPIHTDVLDHDVPRLELAALINAHRAMPLRILTPDSPVLELGMTDPLDARVKGLFSQLYGMSVVPVLVRERELMEVTRQVLSEIALKFREERESTPTDSPVQSRFLEDPEVKKALQQVVASAVKHHASRVMIDLSGPSMKSSFTFGDGLESSVEMSVPPLSVLGSILRRGQVLEEYPDRFQGAARVRFKSVVVNFDFRVEYPAGIRFGEVFLERFVLDSPDNPAFWFGMNERGRDAIRRILAVPSGLTFLTSARESTREFALRAFADSFPDLMIHRVRALSELEPEVVLASTDQRIVVALDVPDVFSVLTLLGESDPGMCEMIRGIVALHQLPRNCPACVGSAPMPPLGQEEVGATFVAMDAHFREGRGCELCSHRGALGFWSACSVVEMRGLSGELLRGGSPWEQAISALCEEGFVSLSEDARAAAALGIVPVRVVGECPKPPESYRIARANEPVTSVLAVGTGLKSPNTRHAGPAAQPESAATVKPPAPPAQVRDRGAQEFEPVRGPDAFLFRPRQEERTDDASSGRDSDEGFFNNFDISDAGEARAFGGGSKAETDDRSLVLVIDDDADQRAILRRVFELAGYRVEVAADGIDGIVSAVRLEPNLIIVDFMMPELDGRETIRRLKQGATTKDIPVVALTAYADPDVELGLLQAGADDFCPKSVSKQVLLKRIERLVRPD